VNKITDIFVDKLPSFATIKKQKGILTKEQQKTNGWKAIPLINSTGKIGLDGVREVPSTKQNGCVKTQYLDNSEILKNLINNIETKFDTTCIGARILKLNKNGYIGEHTDGVQMNYTKYRCHIPITHCYPACWMDINYVSYYMKPNYFYSSNVSYIHSVTNNSDVDRINIVIDILPSEKLIKSINSNYSFKNSLNYLNSIKYTNPIIYNDKHCKSQKLSPNTYIKKKDECINLGQICDPNSILNEIERLQSDFYDKKYIPGKTDKKLYEKTFGWSGIPLININGIDGEEGLRFGGSLNNGLNPKLVKYTKVMEKSIILQELIKNIETKFKTTCIFARILKLKKGGIIYDHTDGDMFNKTKYRCAIPLTKCYPDCWMNINKESYYMEPGNFYSTNVSHIHSVTNNSEVDRINIVIDLLPSEKLIKSIHYGNRTKIIPYYFKKNNNKNLIISFSGFGSATLIKNYDGTTSWEPAHFTLNKTLAKYTNYDKLFIRDLHKTWYSTGLGDITSNVEENVSLLKELTKNYNKIITIGQSSGGYASILYGNLLNVDKVISFSPQIFIDKKTKILKKDTRWMSNNPFYKNINQDSKYLNLNNINLLSKNIIYVGYNDLDRGDLDAVNYLNISKNVEIVKYILPESITNTHYLSRYLVEKGLLNNILTEQIKN
tara:strand:+ start:2607 stop:4598 length:1992 start_codon:yes stop_codon:yes gene_type:complete